MSRMQDFAPLSSAAENVLTSCTQQYPTTLNISLPTLKCFESIANISGSPKSYSKIQPYNL
jgi:hypothetical protein